MQRSGVVQPSALFSSNGSMAAAMIPEASSCVIWFWSVKQCNPVGRKTEAGAPASAQIRRLFRQGLQKKDNVGFV